MSTQLFIPKAKYRVIQNVTIFSFSFVKGEILVFDVGGYSRYDECYFYDFKDSNGNVKVALLEATLSGDEPVDKPEAEALLKNFELLPMKSSKKSRGQPA